jgi:hypothetical protein
MSLMVINGNGALAFDVGFTLNIRHSFDSSARQFQAIALNRCAIACGGGRLI